MFERIIGHHRIERTIGKRDLRNRAQHSIALYVRQGRITQFHAHHMEMSWQGICNVAVPTADIQHRRNTRWQQVQDIGLYLLLISFRRTTPQGILTVICTPG